MKSERKKGITYSAILHGVVLLLAIFGLPIFLTPPPPQEPVATVVDILPIAPKSNVKPTQEAPEPKKEASKPPKPPAPSVVASRPETSPAKPEPKPQPKPEPKPEPTKEEVKPEVKPKPEPKPEPKKEEAKPMTEKQPDKQKKPDKSLDDILKSVKQSPDKSDEKPDPKAKPSPKADDAKKDSKAEAAAKKNNKSTSFDPNSPEAASARDAISGQVNKCWNPPAGAKDASKLIIFVAVQYNQDGSYITAELAAESERKASSDGFYRAAAESALRAVKRCSPLKDMPADTYHIWQNVEIRFDPKDLL